MSGCEECRKRKVEEAQEQAAEEDYWEEVESRERRLVRMAEKEMERLSK